MQNQDGQFRHISMDFIIDILIGLTAGWLAGRIMKGSGYGLAGNLIVGVIGALIGPFIFALIGIPLGGLLGELVMAIVGAVALIYVIRMVRKL
jgi:uncharacterized membrane protein YeaQ/YmgE (transglycosylase-associated protein family)